MPDPDHAEFEAECGKGTYVRSLARDLGRELGCRGHVSALRRTAVGSFGEPDMISLERLESLCHRAAVGEGNLADALFPVATALDDIPALAGQSGRMRPDSSGGSGRFDARDGTPPGRPRYGLHHGIWQPDCARPTSTAAKSSPSACSTSPACKAEPADRRR